MKIHQKTKSHIFLVTCQEILADHNLKKTGYSRSQRFVLAGRPKRSGFWSSVGKIRPDGSVAGLFFKIFFTKSWKFLCDYVIFSPKYAIFYIYFTTKYPSISAKIFWTRKSKENLRNSIHHSFNLYTLQPNTNIDSPLQVSSPRRGPWRVANQSLEVRCSSIIFPPNPKMVYLVLGGSTPIENPS